FNLTAAARTDYKVWDLIDSTPLLTTKERDESKRKWDAGDDVGLRFAKHESGSSIVTVEYWRDIKPILERSCVACHTTKAERGLADSSITNKPAGNLDLDADDQLVSFEYQGKFPGTYYRLALDEGAKFGYRPVGYDSWGYPNASRYIRKM